MYVVTGATGNTGGIVAGRLLERGEKVRVLGRDRSRLEPLVRKGAEALVCDVENATALASAFRGADAVYAVIPPSATAPDVRAYQGRVTDAFTSALRAAAVPRVIVLSSVGADKPDKTGPIAGLHDFEQKVSGLPAIDALFLRATYFLENFLAQARVIQTFGRMAGPLRADLKFPMIATRDIGAHAADAMLRRDFSGKQTRELLGAEDISYCQAASVVGQAIGQSDLAYTQLPSEILRGALLQMGMSASMADLVLEMGDAINSGHVAPLEKRSPDNTTPTTLAQFVADVFVPTYKGAASA